MNHIKNKNQLGAALLIYLIILSLFLALLMAATYSRLFLAIGRGKSSYDSLASSYQAESEVNDILARLSLGYLRPGQFQIRETKTVGNTSIDIVGSESGVTQLISVTVKKPFATTKISATRSIESLNDYENVEILLGLDCTGSMNAGANCPNCNTPPSRLTAQKEAALNFVDRMIALPDRSKFKLGLFAFGIDAKWLRSGVTPVRPSSSVTLEEARETIVNGFGSSRETSPACQGIMDATSIGSAYAFANDYYASNQSSKTKQVIVVITDGEPNSRIPSTQCSPSVFCPGFPKDPSGVNYCKQNAEGWSCHNGSTYEDGPFDADGYNEVAYNTCRPLGYDFLRCTIADKNTDIPSGKGARNENVEAYALTIYSKPPADVVALFNTYLGVNNYFNASRASQLKNLLNNILSDILSSRELITIKRDKQL